MNVPAHFELMYELPPEVQESLRQLLDEDERWEKMVRRLQDCKIEIDVTTIRNLQQGVTSSPGRNLLKFLQYFKVSDVYITFATLDMIRAQDIISDYVDKDTKTLVREKKARKTGGEGSQTEHNITYVYQLPEDVRLQLCNMLDANTTAMDFLFARFESAGFEFWTLRKCRMVSSPSTEFLKLLGDRNFKMSLLYSALASLGLLSAVNLLEKYVSENWRNYVRSHLPENQHPDIKPINVMPHGSQLDGPLCNAPQEDIFGRVVSRGLDRSSRPSTFGPAASYKGIEYAELGNATNQWSKENNLARGREGSFYLGYLNKAKVAIKRLQIQDMEQRNQVLEALRILKSAKHENILEISLLIENSNNNPCVIYPFMEKRSLCDFLRLRRERQQNSNSFCLTWEKKFNIALGIADAIMFLISSFEEKFFLKSSDVLLSNNMEPLVADICLPCMVNEKTSDGLVSYRPQTDPGSRTEGLDEKSAVTFCFRTILLELAMGQPADTFKIHPSFVRTFDLDKLDGCLSTDISMHWLALVGYCKTAPNFVSVVNALKKNALY